MNYVALLRGVNVGGKNIIKMAELKACFENNGFEDVATYIQSGNVIFKSAKQPSAKLELKIESILTKTIRYNSKVLVRSASQIKEGLSQVPDDWKTRNDLRCYLAFLKDPITAERVIQETAITVGVDFLKPGNGVVYMTTLLSGLTRSGINKLVSKPIYQYMTIRNYRTTKKIAELLER